jgi:hypothetical protein
VPSGTTSTVGHAELVRHDEVARQILEHRRSHGIDAMGVKNF